MACIKPIEKEVCVEAKVRVKPEADIGEVEFIFVGEPKRETCDDTLCRECDFMISQVICLRIPVMFSAEAEVVKTGIVCEKENPDCEPHPCDGKREYEGFPFRRNYQDGDKPTRSFARNYLLTYQNNPEPA